jgi:hypothetical protein
MMQHTMPLLMQVLHGEQGVLGTEQGVIGTEHFTKVCGDSFALMHAQRLYWVCAVFAITVMHLTVPGVPGWCAD